MSSNREQITCGVPQGSILGPTLFLLYINDIVQCSNLFNYYIFADDTTLVNSNKNLQQLCRITNEELKKMDEWMCVNKLSLNVEKTKFLLFTPGLKNMPNANPIISIRNKPIERVKTANFLGVIIDEKLTWREHIKHIKIKIARCIGIMFRVRHKLNMNGKLSVYFALVQSHLLYCVSVWGTADKTYLNELKIMQNKYLRLITYKNKTSSTLPEYLRFKILNIFDLYKSNICKFVWSTLNSPKEFPSNIFTNLYKRNLQIHHYGTRYRNDLHANKYRTNIGKKSISHQGQIIWNAMPAKVRNAFSIHQVKRELKN